MVLWPQDADFLFSISCNAESDSLLLILSDLGDRGEDCIDAAFLTAEQ